MFVHLCAGLLHLCEAGLGRHGSVDQRKGWHGGVLVALVFHVQRWQAEDKAQADRRACSGVFGGALVRLHRTFIV